MEQPPDLDVNGQAQPPDLDASGGVAPPDLPADSGVSPWLVGAGALGVGALGAAIHNPSAAKAVAGGLMDLRKTSMLSGLAPLKSLLGNVGGAAMGSIERGSLAPIREMLSPTTFKEAIQTFKQGPNQAIAGPASALSKWNLPGRFMGAFDQAGQNALQRAGYTTEEAEREMLQTPLPKRVGDAFDNPVMDFLMPFRKTPLNQLLEGAKTFNPQTAGQGAALATSMGTGAATGAMAEDPKTIALTTAAHGRYGLPHAMAAGASRYLTGGSKTKSTDVIDAVSDFGSMGRGVMGVVENPASVLGVKPAALPAWDYIKSLFGIQ